MNNKKKKETDPDFINKFSIDDAAFETLFEDKDALTHSTQYLADVLDATLNKTADLRKEVSDDPDLKNTDIEALKREFPRKKIVEKQNEATEKETKQETAVKPGVDTRVNAIAKQPSKKVNYKQEKEIGAETGSNTKDSQINMKTAVHSKPKGVRDKQQKTWLDKLKRPFKTLMAALTKTPATDSVNKTLKSKSMEKSIKRLKDREEKLKDLLDHKGEIT